MHKYGIGICGRIHVRFIHKVGLKQLFVNPIGFTGAGEGEMEGSLMNLRIVPL